MDAMEAHYRQLKKIRLLNLWDFFAYKNSKFQDKSWNFELIK